MVEASLLGDVGKGAVAVVVKQNVVPPEAAEEVVPAIVVVIADAHPSLPAGAGETGFFGDLGESAVAIVLIQMRSGRLARGPMGVEAGTVGEIDVEPAVVVVVEKRQARAFGFDDVVLVVDGTPDVRSGEAGFAGDVDELHWGFGRYGCGGFRLGQGGGLQDGGRSPAPEWRSEGVEE